MLRRTLLSAIALGLAAPRARAQARPRIRIGQATTALSFLPIAAARALDSFAAAEVELQWAAIAGGDPTALAALDAGDIDLAAVGSDTALAAIARGQPFQMVYALMAKMTADLVVSTEFLRRTGVAPGDPLERRIQALRNATLGVSAVRGAQDRAARWLVAQGGLDSARDIRIAQVGPPPALRAALENRQIDGFVLSPPEGLLAEQAGTGRILVRLGDEFGALRNLPYLVLVAKRPLAQEQAMVRAVRALQDASAALLREPERVAGEIHRRFYAQIPLAAVTAAVAAMKDGVARQGQLTVADINALLTFAAQTGGEAERRLDAARGQGEFWSNALVEAARRP